MYHCNYFNFGACSKPLCSQQNNHIYFDDILRKNNRDLLMLLQSCDAAPVLNWYNHILASRETEPLCIGIDMDAHWQV